MPVAKIKVTVGTDKNRNPPKVALNRIKLGWKCLAIPAL